MLGSCINHPLVVLEVVRAILSKNLLFVGVGQYLNHAERLYTGKWFCKSWRPFHIHACYSYLKNNFCAPITYSIMFSFTSAAVSCSVSFAVVLTYLLCASRFYVGPFGKTLKVSNVYNFPRNTKLQLLCVLILLSTSSIQTIFSASKARDGLEALNQCCSVAMRCSYLPANMFVPNSI